MDVRDETTVGLPAYLVLPANQCSGIYEFISREIVSTNAVHVSYGGAYQVSSLGDRETGVRRALEASEHEKRRVNMPDENESTDLNSHASFTLVVSFLLFFFL